jgi:hypothetical protein
MIYRQAANPMIIVLYVMLRMTLLVLLWQFIRANIVGTIVTSVWIYFTTITSVTAYSNH